MQTLRNAMARGVGKAAELASGLGAIALGTGVGLLAPEGLRGFGLPLLAVGALVHALGMTLKHRLENQDRRLLWWENALFWLCWACLGGLATWVGFGMLAA
jgi:hypothetical protein